MLCVFPLGAKVKLVPLIYINSDSCHCHVQFKISMYSYAIFDRKQHSCGPRNFRALVRTGAAGATAPVNFELRVHAPVNFQP